MIAQRTQTRFKLRKHMKIEKHLQPNKTVNLTTRGHTNSHNSCRERNTTVATTYIANERLIGGEQIHDAFLSIALIYLLT